MHTLFVGRKHSFCRSNAHFYQVGCTSFVGRMKNFCRSHEHFLQVRCTNFITRMNTFFRLFAHFLQIGFQVRLSLGPALWLGQARGPSTATRTGQGVERSGYIYQIYKGIADLRGQVTLRQFMGRALLFMTGQGTERCDQDSVSLSVGIGQVSLSVGSGRDNFWAEHCGYLITVNQTFEMFSSFHTYEYI